MSTLALELPLAVGVAGDDQLLEGLRRGDSIAAERLVARYGKRAYRLAMGITRNTADAEEVVQDALWSVIRRIDTFRGDARLGSWLYRIVANAAFAKLRQRAARRREIALDEMPPAAREDGAGPADWSGPLDDPAIRCELRAALSTAIDELSPPYRAVVVLRDVEGLPIAEVARSVGVPISNAKTRLHRARSFLRRRLTRV
jgi:RNA polymerase sigma-70 factor (ECF subfamily)